MNIYLGENDDEIGLMSLRDDLIVLHNGERYTINEYIIKLQKENKQLKLDYELYKDNYVHRNYEVEIRDNIIKQLKEVIEEVREYVNDKLFDDYTYCSYEDVKQNINEILDKIKDVK